MEASIKLHIVVDKKKKRVVFAEAKKDFVDLIFHILSLPLGAVERILAKNTSTDSLGSIGTIQKGLKNIDDQYMQHLAKDYLLDLRAPHPGKYTTLLLPEASWNKTTQFYRCYKDYNTVSLESCEHHTRCSSLQVNFVGKERGLAALRGYEKGYVKEVVSFMVMDDLVVQPAQPATIVSLVSKHSIKEVTFGPAQAIQLLKASITSKTVLTDVFLHGAVEAET